MTRVLQRSSGSSIGLLACLFLSLFWVSFMFLALFDLVLDCVFMGWFLSFLDRCGFVLFGFDWFVCWVVWVCSILGFFNWVCVLG